MKNYVALLRGINVGGNKIVPMAKLKNMLEKIGCTNVKTILASGNVVLESPETSTTKLAAKIAQTFEETFGFDSHIIVRTAKQIEELVKSKPFQGIKVVSETRLYVTFLGEKPKSAAQASRGTQDQCFRILRITEGEICSVLTVTEKLCTTNAMSVLEKEFGKNITTRNWNTVLKLLR